MNKLLTVIYGVLLTSICTAQLPYKTKLIYAESFTSDSALHNWRMEGPGKAQIDEGKLLLQSKYAKATAEYLLKNKTSADNGVAYYDFVENLVEKDADENVEAYKVNDNFVGGHIVFWNNMPTPDNYVLEFDFQNLSNYPLHMIMFSHMGLDGQSVFSPHLKKRNGVALQYTKSDLSGYRISFFAPERKTTHLRKSPEKQVLIKGTDLTLKDLTAVHHLRVIKYHNKVTWQINNETAFEYLETAKAKVLGGGYFAFRLMVPAIAYYDNVKVFEIIE